MTTPSLETSGLVPILLAIVLPCPTGFDSVYTWGGSAPASDLLFDGVGGDALVHSCSYRSSSDTHTSHFPFQCSHVNAVCINYPSAEPNNAFQFDGVWWSSTERIGAVWFELCQSRALV